MPKVGLWNHASVAMSFTASKGGQTDLGTAVTKATEVRQAAELLLGALKDKKVKYDDELKRRTDQKTLYNTATDGAAKAKTALTDATTKVTEWATAKALTLTKLDTAQKIIDESAKLPALIGADVQAVANYRNAFYEATEITKVTALAKTAMDEAYAAVVVKKALEQEKYIKLKVYDETLICGAAGDKCKAGGLNEANLATINTNIAPLLTVIATYEQKRIDYAKAYDQSTRFGQLRDSAEADMNGIGTAYGDDKVAKNTATALDDKSAGYLAWATKAVANAKMNCDETDFKIKNANTDVSRLVSNEVIAQHIRDLATDKFNELKGALDSAKDLKATTEA